MDDFNRRLSMARDLSRHHLGDTITFYLPGMFSCERVQGMYPTISITGNSCDLQCSHCGGKILEGMIPATTPRLLIEECRKAYERGMPGVLISGGCDGYGELPWGPFLEALRTVKDLMGLYISVHSGLVSEDQARELKQAGIDQALIDVVGDDATFQKVCNVPFGVERIEQSMAALCDAGIPLVPHVVCGLHNGRIAGEKRALAMISRFPVSQVVIVSLMNVAGSGSGRVLLPTPEEVAEVIVEARFLMPRTILSLGCARERGNRLIETLAIDAGINRLALPSHEALERAESSGRAIRFQKTCCSFPVDVPASPWLDS